MAVNDLAPGFVKVFYTVASRQHVQVIPVLPSGSVTPGVEPTFETKSGGTVGMNTGVDAYLNAVKGLMNTGAVFSSAEFWSKPSAASDPVFIYAYAPSVAGTAAAATVAWSQAVTTFRTLAGGIYRHYLMDQVSAANLSVVPPSSGNIATFFTYMVGSTSWIVGRDNSFLFVPLRRITKINDALRKKFLLDE